MPFKNGPPSRHEQLFDECGSDIYFTATSMYILRPDYWEMSENIYCTDHRPYMLYILYYTDHRPYMLYILYCTDHWPYMLYILYCMYSMYSM